ncbi:MAG: hypothetical protein ABIH39_00140, partial [Candidatus Margulisiibacteriota bacterium]
MFDNMAAKKSINPQKPAGKTRKKASVKKAFPIAGIGASAGGLEAFKELLKNLPADINYRLFGQRRVYSHEV